MYKYLLCWRYLKTRYIALASVVSVMLGVATMIVVNSVMAGFSYKMRDRLHNILADVVVESYHLDGFYGSNEVMTRIKQAAGKDIDAMAPTMETFGLMTISRNGSQVTRWVQIMGVRAEERTRTGGFAEFLVDEKDRPLPASFEVSRELRLKKSPAGLLLQDTPEDSPFHDVLEKDALTQVPDHGAFVGYATATIHSPGAKEDFYIAERGDKVVLTFPAGGRKPAPAVDSYTVLGFFKSGMSEHDSTHVYVPLERLQFLRGLGDGKGAGAVNQIQIKARPGVDLDRLSLWIATALEKPWPRTFRVSTWEQKQGPLLGAVKIEQSILNILLFFIIAVAGFGILAIFSMIVVEKTRDIGILKALGASTGAVRSIFLGYGLALGLVGSGIGMAGGLLFVAKINDIEKWLSEFTGHKVFDDSIYYFKEIPTLVEPTTVCWIVFGALLIAVFASIWPAQRASKLQPVQALRFE